MTVEQQIADMQQASVEQTQASQALADEVAGKMGEIDSKVNEAEQKVEDFIAGAKAEYVRFSHYVALPEKLGIPALGLSDQEVSNYSYTESADYVPAKDDGTLCFVDIPEFANGFSMLTIPPGMSVYLHLLMNVSGSNTLLMSSKVNLLIEKTGQSGYHDAGNPTVPYLYRNEGNQSFTVEGRDWGDKYLDRNEIKLSNYIDYDDYSSGSLRVINLGENHIEIFGIGIEVRA